MSYNPESIKIVDGRIHIRAGRLAESLGVSVRTLANWASDGCPRIAPGWYDFEEVLKWRGLTVAAQKGDATRDPAEMTLAQQKQLIEIELKQAQREALTFKHDLEAGQYLSREKVEDDLTALFSDIRQTILALPRRAATLLIGSMDSEDVKTFEQEMKTTVVRVLDRMRLGDFTDAQKKSPAKRGRTIKRL